MVDIKFPPALVSWKRSLLRLNIHMRSLILGNVYVRIAAFLATELAIIVSAFCTNFLSGFILKSFTIFQNTRVKALDNALRIVKIEKSLGIFVEQDIQEWNSNNIRGWAFWNTYYAGAHPAITAGVLIALLARTSYWFFFNSNWKQVRDYADNLSPLITKKLPFHQQSYKSQYYFLRTVWVVSAWITFFGFLLIPTMPPRLLPACNFMNDAGINIGGCLTVQFTFMDSIGRYGSLLWDWNDPSVKNLNNPYAAFPSQHALFSGWVAMVCIMLWGPSSKIVPAFQKPLPNWFHFLGRWSVIIYPAITIYCIVVTANHFLIDAIGGLFALFVSYFIAKWWYSAKNSDEAFQQEMLPV